MLSRPLAIAITVLVSLVWAANVTVGLIYPDRADATISAIFAIVVGAVYGLTPKRGQIAEARRRLAERIGGGTPAEDEPGEEEPAEDPADDPPARGDQR